VTEPQVVEPKFLSVAVQDIESSTFDELDLLNTGWSQDTVR